MYAGPCFSLHAEDYTKGERYVGEEREREREILNEKREKMRRKIEKKDVKWR